MRYSGMLLAPATADSTPDRPAPAATTDVARALPRNVNVVPAANSWGAWARQRTVDALVIDGASGLQNQRLIHGHRDVVLDADGRAIVEDGRGRRHRAGTGIRAPRGEQKEHGKHDGHDFEPVLET